MIRHRRFAWLVLVLVCMLVPIAAQAPDAGRLTIDRLFAGAEFRPERFGPARWLDDGAGYTTVEPSPQGGRDIVRYDSETGRREVIVAASRLVPPGAPAPLDIDDYDWSADGRLLKIFTNTRKVWRQNTRGDYWVIDLAGGAPVKLGGSAPEATLMFAKFSPDGTRAAYVRERNIYVEDLRTHEIAQVTTDGSASVINGTFDWMYEEELGLRDGFRWSPDSRAIAYWQIDTDGVRDFFLINNTDSLYPVVTPIQYPKVGETISTARIGVVAAAGGATRWMEVPGDPRAQYLARMEWAGNPDEIVFQRINRVQNRNDVMIGDARTGGVRTVLTEQDDAWVDVGDDFRWIDGGRRFVWVSERDGWRHVYTFDRSGRQQVLVTPGAFDAIAVQRVDERGGWLYFIASPDNPTQRYLFRTRLAGQGAPERLTPVAETGTHGYDVSPDGRWAFHTWSSFDRPPTIDLVRLPEHRSVRTLAANTALKAKVAALARVPTEFFRVDIGEGVKLDGWCIKPPDLQPGRKYPLLVQVYGEPAGQTVLDRWGGNTYLWHQMLAQHGYVVVSVDNRGTPAPRGRAWRKAIYRQIGILASKDQAAAVTAIADWPFVDAGRIGVWGWSGGGSMTLNAMFRYPDLYTTGLAVAAVSDQRLYDALYQERYMGLLADNPDGYRDGSPITYADRLKGNLLVVHGTGDDNVHYQSAERLVNALVRANRPFTMMAYPNRTHSISEGENTSRHLYTLLTSYLEEHLKPGPR